MGSIYEDGRYGELNPTWHAEDSAWKAGHIAAMIARNGLTPATCVDVGCGAGGVLAALSPSLPGAELHGYDVSAAALDLARVNAGQRLHFHHGDAFGAERSFDLLLAIDVVEHVPDCFGFARACQKLARWKIYHFPLDLHVMALLRGLLVDVRRNLGHLHYFTAETALALLAETGHRVLDVAYTDGALGLAHVHRQTRRQLANVVRRLVAVASVPWAARLLGGWSLLVLAE